MIRHYDNYFTVDPGYTANMTREAINENPRTWLQFFPHDKYVGFLAALLEQMDGGTKSIWLTGNYGTGKSHAALVTQKLFMDDESRVKEWFEKRNHLISDIVQDALWERRNEGILVVYDYNSDGLGANEHFLVRLEQSIISALKDRKDYVLPPKANIDTIIDRILEEDSNFFKQRDQMQSELAYLNKGISTTEKLIEQLKNPKAPSGLLEDVQKVLWARSIYLDISAEHFFRWVDEVLSRNNLSKLIYIFDEFSWFVDHHKDELKTFEQVAEAANSGKFYFIPVTHMSINAYWAPGSQSAKKANDRFIFKELEMPNDTAFQLAADALKVIPENIEEWMNYERPQLWNGVKDIAEFYFKEEEVRRESFKSILPLHPMAAFVLKHLSTAAGSNQRSIFEYLKGSANGREFKEFIHEGGPTIEGKQYLTVDYLWKYFMEREDLGLSQDIRAIRSEFERQKNLGFSDEEVRVLKTIMLFCLLDKLSPNGHERLQPTVQNIELSFRGDGALVGVSDIIKNLSDKHCFSIVNGRIELFRSLVGGAELEKEKDKYRGKFNSLLSEKTADDLKKKIKPFDLSGRFEVRVSDVSSINSSNISNRERFAKDGGNQVLVQFIFAKDKDDQLLIPDKIKSLLKHFHDHRMLFLSFPNLTFCDNNANLWEEYITQYAQMMLENDQSAKKARLITIDEWNSDWFERIKSQDQVIKGYKPVEGSEGIATELSWGNLKSWLLGFTATSIPYCIDIYAQEQLTAFSTSGLKTWALSGMQFDTANANSLHKQLISRFKQQGIIDSPDWFNQNPQHPITKIWELCEKKLSNTVGKGSNCSVRKIYIELQREPYGMRYNALTAFVLGFVLKGWLTKNLQWTNEQITRPLDAITLAEIIESVVQDDSENKIKAEKLICRLSKEEKAFVEQSPKMFGITSSNPDGTVESALLLVQTRIEQVSGRVPLWILPEYIKDQADPQAEIYESIIEKICEAGSISSKGKTEDRSNAIKEVGKILLETSGVADGFSSYIKTEIFNMAFRKWVDKIEPQLSDLALENEDYVADYCQAIKEKARETAGWLWKKSDMSEAINEVVYEYQAVNKIKPLLGSVGFLSYKTASAQFRKVIINDNKLPKGMILKKYPILEDLLNCVEQPENTNCSKTIKDILERNFNLVNDLFFEPSKAVQINILGESLGDFSSMFSIELQSIYDTIPSGFAKDENSFLSEVKQIVSQHQKDSVTGQIWSSWTEKTGEQSPDDWALKYNLPAWVIFKLYSNALEILTALENPGNFSVEKLNQILKMMRDLTVPNIPECQKYFIETVIPSKYLKFDIDLSSLINFLAIKYGEQMNTWPVKPDVKEFIEQQYQSSIGLQVVEKIKALSGDEAKKRLVELAKENPDIGLAFWE